MMGISARGSRPLIIGIDGSRNRSGGARAHLIGIIEHLDPVCHGISEVHVWAYKGLLDALPERSWLHKHAPAALEKGLVAQLHWQMSALSDEAKKAHCDIMFATDASTLCNFDPLVVLSQDMLSYEKGVMAYFGFGQARLRLWVILLVQNAAFRRARGVMFLTRYAQRIIEASCGKLAQTAVVAHGVGEQFRRIRYDKAWPDGPAHPIVCTYVSNAEMYKHQWVVVEAFALLRGRGHNVRLVLVGGGEGRAQRLLDASISRFDPHRILVEQVAFVSQAELLTYLAKTDVFVFASSCENQPVTLLEAMAAGLPIACSDRGPMPEVLEGAGMMFDPEDPEAIANAVERLIVDPAVRRDLARRSLALAQKYTWAQCADETFKFIVNTYWSSQTYANS